MSNKRISTRHRSAARQRMAQTGEKYTAALAAVLADARRDTAPRRDSRGFLEEDGVMRTRMNGVPSQRLHMDSVHRLVAGASADESARVYLWSRDLGDFEAILEHCDGAERDEEELGSLLASARTHGDEKVIVVIDHQGVLGYRSVDLLTSLCRDTENIEVVYAERSLNLPIRRDGTSTMTGRDLIAKRLAPAQFGLFGTSDEIIRALRARGVTALRDQRYRIIPITEGPDNLAKSCVRDAIRLALIERGLEVESYDIAQHADAVIESLVAAGTIEFPEGMLVPFGDDAR